MIIYLVRHGADDGSRRGGWSDAPLTDEGRQQSEALAERLRANGCDAELIISSDLPRAKQTAAILAQRLSLAVEYQTAFREVNNGDLAGMDNDIANELYPSLYWRNLAWDQPYPNGESPREFYERVKAGWEKLLGEKRKDMILVTHGGVIGVIQCLVNGDAYSNQNCPYRLGAAEAVRIDI